jgi:hypothetical protein
MRLFSSPLWTRCLQVSRMALTIFTILASFQLLAQAQEEERTMAHPTGAEEDLGRPAPGKDHEPMPFSSSDRAQCGG